jgi:hypothetical protein
MTRLITVLSIVAGTIFLNTPHASGQLFGQRNVGQPLSRQTAAARNTSARGGATPAKEPPSGLVDESARFIRGNREVSDFVGADGGDDQSFVGRQQVGALAEEIRSAVDELEIQTGPDANQTAEPMMPARVQLYAPRLKVAFDFAPTGVSEVNARLSHHLEASLPAVAANQIEVSVAGNAATLRGVVASEWDRKLAELLLRFEPGIARVENQLQIQPALPSPPQSPPLPPQTRSPG